MTSWFYLALALRFQELYRPIVIARVIASKKVALNIRSRNCQTKKSAFTMLPSDRQVLIAHIPSMPVALTRPDAWWFHDMFIRFFRKQEGHTSPRDLFPVTRFSFLQD